MFFARRRAAVRLAATTFAAGLLTAGAIATAGPAAAQTVNPRDGGVTASLDGLTVFDRIDVVIDGETRTYGGGLFNLTADDGGTLQTYCIDFNTGAQTGAQYKETPWESSSLQGNPDAGRINWILQNSYPSVDDLAALASQAGVDALTAEQAAAGTQAAIWHLSDGVEATPQNENAAALTDWLLANAEEVAEPGASLQLSPPQVAGKPGEIIGPITVSTTADAVHVTPDQAAADQGVTIVDVNGEYVTESDPVTDGTELYFSVPADAADGTASLTATATSQVPVGRAFTGIDTVTQTMILAGSSSSEVTAGASVTWAAEGPAPAVTAQENCAEGGVDITATNEGDQPFVFVLDNQEYEVAPGDSETVTFPVENGQGYEITITGLDGSQEWSFEGFLDCDTAGDGGMEQIDEDELTPATTGGSSPDLAETGSDSGSPVMIAGIAAALLAVGGATVIYLRRRQGATAAQ
ncbi:Cys-Gln thioester bond-forming surface protein [Streptomyces sp. 4N509B]|uniref:Cys-Gln thioester bond-forming surface protein n=1 Tax=Streptomyces sp. 4N509B TaxID=3457413 RepID=UPI003FD05AEE